MPQLDQAPLFGIKPGYAINPTPAYFHDAPTGLTYQPHVYELADYLHGQSGTRFVIDLGAGNGEKLARFVNRAEIIVVDQGPNLVRLRERIACQQIEADFAQGLPPLPDDVLAQAIVVCADVVEHLPDPGPLLHGLARWARVAPFVLISTPERLRARGAGDLGPPANPAHVREWTLDEFADALRACELPCDLLGLTINTDHHHVKSTILAISGGHACCRPAQERSVLAIVNVYNERDMIEETIHHLLREGLDVHIVDNWSNDGSFEAVQAMGPMAGRLRLSRFPDAPSDSYEWHRLLTNSARLALESGYDWVWHQDADELRRSPWSGVNLRSAISHVDALGYNAIDFTVIDFRPVTEVAGSSSRTHEDTLRFFEFGGRPGHFLQVKAWKQPETHVDLASSGGHDVQWPSRRVFPLKFLTKHYPLRSVAQAERKVFHDRKPRMNMERAERGWHTQYDRFSAPDDIRWSRCGLHAWSDHLFASEFLVERLSGIGIPRVD